MYQINLITNEIIELQTKTFSELKFRERENLQEWIAKLPNSLGEELLIIQKEFDGFDETRERLDLLALDKSGNLVLIENKLDDSGRDVVWQSLKYASYCSSLKKTDIERIYQDYLKSNNQEGDAAELISEFLEASDSEDLILNSGNNQRIKLVAANFRKEVTSTALWLLGHGIQIECFKVTPYVLGESIFLNFEQIIPTPEAKDFMIGISEKEKEEQQLQRTRKRAEGLRVEFWKLLLEELNSCGVLLFQNISPSDEHWISAGSGLRSVTYNLIFSKYETRVEVYASRSQKTENKEIFDLLYLRKEEIEGKFGEPLEWQRLDDKKACRIKFAKSFDGYNKENWPAMIEWLCEYTPKLENAFKKPIESVRAKVR